MISLVTGATGFVGSWLCEYLLTKKNMEVHGLKRWRSPMENINQIAGKDGLKLHDGDLRDAVGVNKVIKKVKPDYIFHIAAQSFVPYSFDNPHETITTNINGTINLLESIKENKLNPRIVVTTSSEVYGQVTKEDLPITEDCPFRPQSPYGVSKAGEDLIAYQYHCSYNMNIIRARLFTHSGPRRGDAFFESSFAKQIAMIELGLQKPVIKVGNLSSIRTFLDIRDAVKAYWLLATKCPAGEVYNIGGDAHMSVGDYLKEMMNMSSMKDKIKVIVDPSLLRPSDVTLQIPSSEKFRKATGWKPKYSYLDTLRSLLDYWRAKTK